MKRTIIVAVAVVAMLAGVLAYASAATTVTVNATAGSHLELGMIDTTWNVGTLVPDASDTYVGYDVSVRSNKGYNIAVAYNLGTLGADSVLSGTLTPGAKDRSDGSTWAHNLDDITLKMGWALDALQSGTGSVVYTVTN